MGILKDYNGPAKGFDSEGQVKNIAIKYLPGTWTFIYTFEEKGTGRERKVYSETRNGGKQLFQLGDEVRVKVAGPENGYLGAKKVEKYEVMGNAISSIQSALDAAQAGGTEPKPA